MAKQIKTKYLFTTPSATGIMIITYVNGVFKQMERKAGTYNDHQWKRISSIIPLKENDIANVKIPNVELTKFTPIPKGQKIFKRFNEVYFDFHRNRLNIDPKFGATEGKALKEIIKYLTSQSKDEEEALTVWQLIFNNWEHLTPYYQGKIRLVEINSNLVNIIDQIKNGEHSKEAGDNIADEIRRKYENRSNS